jgi:Mrp family chromosome partitioning ATPase
MVLMAARYGHHSIEVLRESVEAISAAQSPVLGAAKNESRRKSRRFGFSQSVAFS